MTGWGIYTGAWALFLISHAVPVRPRVKPWLVARLSVAGFGIAYSTVSLGALTCLFIAASLAPHVPLWPMPTGAHWIVLAGMVPAAILLALTLGRPNPFSFGGARNAQFDPDRPELIGLIRHPVLVALGLWSGAHLIVNGDLAHGLMFAGFAGFALLGMAIVDRRKQRELGRENWLALRTRSRCATLALPEKATLRLVIAAGCLCAIIAGHRWLSGVVIWPRFMP